MPPCRKVLTGLSPCMQVLPGVMMISGDSGHLLAGCDNRSPRAPKGSLPALDCTPVAREGVQIDQGVLLPE